MCYPSRGRLEEIDNCNLSVPRRACSGEGGGRGRSAMAGYCYYQHFEIPVASPILRGNDSDLNVQISNAISHGSAF